MLCARQQLTRNPLIRIRCNREVPHDIKNKKRERKQTQYLTRFDNLPTSSGQGRESFIDLTTNINLILISGFVSNWIRLQFRNKVWILKGRDRYACRSTGRSTDPSTQATGQSTVSNRKSHHVRRSTGRSTILLLQSIARSTELSCARLCTSRVLIQMLLVWLILF